MNDLRHECDLPPLPITPLPLLPPKPSLDTAAAVAVASVLAGVPMGTPIADDPLEPLEPCAAPLPGAVPSAQVEKIIADMHVGSIEWAYGGVKRPPIETYSSSCCSNSTTAASAASGIVIAPDDPLMALTPA